MLLFFNRNRRIVILVLIHCLSPKVVIVIAGFMKSSVVIRGSKLEVYIFLPNFYSQCDTMSSVGNKCKNFSIFCTHIFC